MSITFNCEADVILWAFAKLLSIFAERQYTFALHCIWWLASLVQLDIALLYLIEYHQFPSENRETSNNKIDRQISPIPRDLQNDSRGKSISNHDTEDQLCIDQTIIKSRNTWQPKRINNQIKSKKQEKRTQRLKRIQTIKKSEEAKRVQERRARIIKRLGE